MQQQGEKMALENEPRRQCPESRASLYEALDRAQRISGIILGISTSQFVLMPYVVVCEETGRTNAQRLLPVAVARGIYDDRVQQSEGLIQDEFDLESAVVFYETSPAGRISLSERAPRNPKEDVDDPVDLGRLRIGPISIPGQLKLQIRGDTYGTQTREAFLDLVFSTVMDRTLRRLVPVTKLEYNPKAIAVLSGQDDIEGILAGNYAFEKGSWKLKANP